MTYIQVGKEKMILNLITFLKVFSAISIIDGVVDGDGNLQGERDIVLTANTPVFTYVTCSYGKWI